MSTDFDLNLRIFLLKIGIFLHHPLYWKHEIHFSRLTVIWKVIRWETQVDTDYTKENAWDRDDFHVVRDLRVFQIFYFKHLFPSALATKLKAELRWGLRTLYYNSKKKFTVSASKSGMMQNATLSKSLATKKKDHLSTSVESFFAKIRQFKCIYQIKAAEILWASKDSG